MCLGVVRPLGEHEGDSRPCDSIANHDRAIGRDSEGESILSQPRVRVKMNEIAIRARVLSGAPVVNPRLRIYLRFHGISGRG